MRGSRIRYLIVGIAAGGLAALLAAGCAPLDTSFKDPWHARLAAAGIVEKDAAIGDVDFNYAEGPDNGPALLLLHAQHMEWYSYSRVLPELSESFHVFAVSYNGHGKTEAPVDRMSAGPIGNDLAAFIETVIEEPAFVTGNSSGGLLATWLAANEPGLVRAVLLEDPPLFTAEYPRSKSTVAYRTFTTAHEFLAGDNSDFLIYWLNANKDFMKKRAGPGSLDLIVGSIRKYRPANPGQPVELNFLPDILRLFVRGIDRYDPHFGDAFYDGSWNEGFDHADALGRIKCPVLLLHANFEFLKDGTLNGAMSEEDADRAASLPPDCEYVRIDAAHTVHIDKPGEFIELAKSFFSGSRAAAGRPAREAAQGAASRRDGGRPAPRS
jgi:pimeloyl-ACP methyl ester carboxylesterase